MDQVLEIFETIKPLISNLSDSERLELIRSIAVSQPYNRIYETEDELFQQRLLSEQNIWYARSLEEKLRYRGEYVALSQGQVVDHDANRTLLLRRVRQEFGMLPVPIIPAEQDSLPEYTIRNPQIVD